MIGTTNMKIISRELVSLMEDVMCGVGMLDDEKRRYTKPYQQLMADNKKITCEPQDYNPEPGAPLKITWQMDGYTLEDDGYILTLPGFDRDDIWMSGIVHVPEPDGCEKSKCDPEWIYLDRLISMPTCKEIKFVKVK